MNSSWHMIGLIGVLVCMGGVICLYAATVCRCGFIRGIRTCCRHPILLALAIAATVYAGRKGRITYPRTSPEVDYLQDAGSNVYSNGIHVVFHRLIVPDSANLYIDYRAIDDEGDDSAWVNFITTTFKAFADTGETDFEYRNATNFDWVVYTDWTPGPVVQTNGVWHTMWANDARGGMHIIPLRTSLRVDSTVIATPKSKEDNK